MLKIFIEILQHYVLFSSEENFEVSLIFVVIACTRHCTETVIKCSKEYVFALSFSEMCFLMFPSLCVGFIYLTLLYEMQWLILYNDVFVMN
jgi:hypothetical protein